MKKILPISIALICISLLYGCNRSGLSPEIRTPRYYLYFMSSGQIAGLSINPQTGLLTKNPGSPYSTSAGNIWSLGADSANNLLLLSGFSNLLLCLAANPGTGDLTVLSSTSATTSESLVVSPLYRTVYLGTGSNTLLGFSYNTSCSVNSLPGSPYNGPNGINNNTMAIDPLNRFVFAVNSTMNYIAIGSGGVLGPLLTAGGSSPALDPVVDQTGNYLYAVDTTSNVIDSFLINRTNGTLTNKLSYGSSIGTLVSDLSNNFIFATGAGTVVPFKMSTDGSTLTQLTSTAISPTTMALDPTGHYLYTSDGGGNVTTYAVNQTTGTLMQIQGPFFIGISGLVLYPYLAKFYF